MSAAAKTARCQYCGGQPCAGGTDLFALVTGKQKKRFMCMPCTQEFRQFTNLEMESIPEGLSRQKQIAAIETLLKVADGHMKEWVSKRLS